MAEGKEAREWQRGKGIQNTAVLKSPTSAVPWTSGVPFVRRMHGVLPVQSFWSNGGQDYRIVTRDLWEETTNKVTY